METVPAVEFLRIQLPRPHFTEIDAVLAQSAIVVTSSMSEDDDVVIVSAAVRGTDVLSCARVDVGETEDLAATKGESVLLSVVSLIRWCEVGLLALDDLVVGGCLVGFGAAAEAVDDFGGHLELDVA